MEKVMRASLQTLQQHRVRRLVSGAETQTDPEASGPPRPEVRDVGMQAKPSRGHALVQVGASKKVHSVGTSYDLISSAPAAVESGPPPVTHSAEIQTEPAYMEREGGTGAPDPTTALAVPSVSSGSLQPYSGRVTSAMQSFNQFSKSSVLPAGGAAGGGVAGFRAAGPAGAVLGGHARSHGRRGYNSSNSRRAARNSRIRYDGSEDLWRI